eukprot:6492353-Amphidinium_carterae.1
MSRKRAREESPRTPNYRRGVRQRVQELDEEEGGSHLKALLLAKYFGGSITAVEIQEITDAACKDGANKKEVKRCTMAKRENNRYLGQKRNLKRAVSRFEDKEKSKGMETHQ